MNAKIYLVRQHVLLCCVIVSILLCSCQDDFNDVVSENGNIQKVSMNEEYDQSLLYHLPLLSFDELDSICRIWPDGVLHYKLARQYAYGELIANFKALFMYRGSNSYPVSVDLAENRQYIGTVKLTNRPVVVFGFDELPYYYEFGVIYGNDLIGTITVDARPYIEGELIEYAFSPALKYSSYSFQYRRYVGDYPNVYFGHDKNSMFKVLQREGTHDGGGMVDYTVYVPLSSCKTEPENQLYEKLSSMPDSIAVTLDGQLHYYSDEYSSFGEIMDSMGTGWASWRPFYEKYNMLDSTATPYVDLIPDEFVVHPTEMLVYLMKSTEGMNKYTFIESFIHTNGLLQTRWTGPCGPSAMTWMYVGMKRKYDNFEIPLYGQSHPNTKSCYKINNTLKISYYNYSEINHNDFYTAATRSYNSDNGLYYRWWNMTDNNIQGNPLYQWGINKGLSEVTNDHYRMAFMCIPVKWIMEKNSPVLIECSPGGIPHYVVAFGASHILNSKGKVKSKFLFVYDNGTTISEHDYKPYWKKFNCWNLHYGWTIKK